MPGREKLVRNLEEISEISGPFAWSTSFPALDAASLRPCHMFSDKSALNTDLFYLLRRTYPGQSDRSVGTMAYFEEVDRQMAELDKRDNHTPLPIALIRHPGLIHLHPYLTHRKSLRRLSEHPQSFLMSSCRRSLHVARYLMHTHRKRTSIQSTPTDAISGRAAIKRQQSASDRQAQRP